MRLLEACCEAEMSNVAEAVCDMLKQREDKSKSENSEIYTHHVIEYLCGLLLLLLLLHTLLCDIPFLPLESSLPPATVDSSIPVTAQVVDSTVVKVEGPAEGIASL